MFFIRYMIFILIILFTHLMAYNTQIISGNQYFYGVFVDKIYIRDKIKKDIDKNFKNKLNLSLILTILIYILIEKTTNINIGLTILMTIFIYLGLYFLLLKKSYKLVKYAKEKYLSELNIEQSINKSNKKYIEEDKVIIELKKKIKKKFIILYSICIGLSLLSFLYVIISYNKLPDIIITHWGSGGRADGFSSKNIINVFYINFIDITMVILFTLIGIGSISSAVYIDYENIELNRKKAIQYINGIGYSFFILTLTIQSLTTTIPIFMVKQKNIPIQLVFIVCILPIFIAIVVIYFYIMLGSIKPKSKGIYTTASDDENWIYGFIYYNKEDPNFMVEKRLGAGWNVNMAHPLGKFFTILTILILIGSFAVCFI